MFNYLFVKSKLRRNAILILMTFSLLILSLTGNAIKIIRERITNAIHASFIQKLEDIEIQARILKSNTELSDIEVINTVLKDVKLNYNSYLFAVKNSGDYIFHPTEKGQNIKNSSFFNSLKKNNSVKFHKIIYGDKEIWQFYKYSENFESYIGIVTPLKPVMSDIHSSMVNIRIIIPLFFVLFFVVTIILIQPIINSLRKITKFAEDIGAGNLKTTLNINRTDEIGDTAHALETMSKNIKIVIENVIESAKLLSDIQRSINNVSDKVMDNVTQHASKIEDVSKSLQQITTGIEHNFTDAKNAERKAIESALNVEAGNQSVQKTVDALVEISKKISVIENIASQTDLLALNAAVEAAHAGELGKGFSVISNDVKDLAKKSKQAAEGIKELSKVGFEIAEEAKVKSNQSVEEINEIKLLIQSISNKSEDQKSHADLFYDAIEQFKKIIDRNLKTAEEITANANKLSDQSKFLNKTVSYFNT